MTARASLWLLIVATLACSAKDDASAPASTSAPAPDTKPANAQESPETAPETLPPPSSLPPLDGFFMAEGAPPPRSCEVADDCLGDTIPELDNPCCQNPLSLEPYARAYRKWLNRWRADNCAAVECPPPPAPSLPPRCAFEVRCVGGLCADTCGA